VSILPHFITLPLLSIEAIDLRIFGSDGEDKLPLAAAGARRPSLLR
jgi:hypothetical protein